MYRVNQSLLVRNERIPAGKVMSLPFSAKTIDALLASGAISEIAAPPLSILPGWEERAINLAGIEVITVTDFLAAGTKDVAEVLEVPEEQVEGVKEDVKKWLTPPEEEYVPFTTQTFAEFGEVPDLPVDEDEV